MSKTEELDELKTDFAMTLMRQGNGATNSEASVMLRDLAQRVRDTGKAGTITLQLRIAPIKNTTQVAISDKLSVKAPEYDRPTTIYYTTEDGEITRDDPDQPSLFNVKEVKRPSTAVVDLTTGEIMEGNNDE